MANTPHEAAQILRLPDLIERIRLSRSSIYTRLDPKSRYHDPHFPKPIRLGANSIGWRAIDVANYIEGLTSLNSRSSSPLVSADS